MTDRHRILDTFSCAGGAAKGYHDAGFDLVGVDIRTQKRYPYAFVQGDALAVLRLLLDGGEICASDGRGYRLCDFSAVHASPPCQKWCAMSGLPNAKAHDDLLTPCRELLQATGLPYIIENVRAAPLKASVMLCGTMFGLRTECGAELWRHRYFEMNWDLGCLVPPCQHRSWSTGNVIGVHGGGLDAARRRVRPVLTINATAEGSNQRRAFARRVIGVYGGHVRDRRRVCTVAGNALRRSLRDGTENFSVEARRQAMGISWMSGAELSQAIPPAYARFLGERLLAHLEAEASSTP